MHGDNTVRTVVPKMRGTVYAALKIMGTVTVS